MYLSYSGWILSMSSFLTEMPRDYLKVIYSMMDTGTIKYLTGSSAQLNYYNNKRECRKKLVWCILALES